MHLQSSSMYSDALRIRLRMLRNSAPPPASMPLHVLPLLVCLFVCLPLSLVHMLLVCLFLSPYCLFLLIDGRPTLGTSNCTCRIRTDQNGRLIVSFFINSLPIASI